MDLGQIIIVITIGIVAISIMWIIRESNRNINYRLEKMDNSSNQNMERDKLIFQKEFEKYFGEIKVHQNEQLNVFNQKLEIRLRQEFRTISNDVNRYLEKINYKVDNRLKEGFDKTNQTFNNILMRLSKIDEAQKKIESLSTNIISLQEILSDKKTRGTFGEIQLENILVSIFGQNNPQIYKLQNKLINGNIVDAILFTPEPMGKICIDSKFPLENYKIMIDKNKSDTERQIAEKQFVSDVKKHIDDISKKYIIVNETSPQAIMFIPAEAVFAEINAYHSKIIEYAQKRNIWLASPTTLMSLLTTVQVIIRNIERDKYSSIIHEELNKLGEEFKRYRLRWDNLAKHIDTVSKDVKEIHVSTNKITNKFDKISHVNLKDEIESNINNKILDLDS